LKDYKLRIGRITYANLYPFFYYLENECNNHNYIFIDGVPSELNKLLRKGELDVSPSSSIEYLRNRDKYMILPGLSISSKGRIKSILLFGRYPIEDLDGKEIAISHESDTSSEMLKIILSKFFSLRCRFHPVRDGRISELLSHYSAVLLIGDRAMRETKNSGLKKDIYIYDLGELWDRFTGLPFVYALWLVRREAFIKKKALIEGLSLDLLNAKISAPLRFRKIARLAPQREWLSQKELIDYWHMISYDFTEDHMRGLRLFEEYCHRIFKGLKRIS